MEHSSCCDPVVRKMIREEQERRAHPELTGTRLLWRKQRRSGPHGVSHVIQIQDVQDGGSWGQKEAKCKAQGQDGVESEN